jgi:hypothetical protein
MGNRAVTAWVVVGAAVHQWRPRGVPRLRRHRLALRGRPVSIWVVGCLVTDDDEGPPSTGPLLYVVEIPFALLGLWLVWGSSADGFVSLGGALLVAVSAFALGFVILAWLYRFARRRVEQDVKPKPWEYWLEEHGWWLLPPAVALGVWASQFGANDGWGSAVGGAAALAIAGFGHGLVFLTSPQVPKSHLTDTRDGP